ncbi:MAG: excinuclease ABC subunit UvrA [Bacteroidota bacterium]
MQEKFIHIKGARVHNLKNIDVKIQHGKITVITGLSGSGKSSLAFDTLYAEGQRRYVESLSSYARQFLGKLDKPETDFIKGISPAIAIEQKVISSNPRSTVGTVTEIYDYLKLLYARIGKTYSPISGNEVKKHSVTDVINFIKKQEEGTKVYILAPITSFEKYGFERQISLLKDQGYVRLLIENEVFDLDDKEIESKKYSIAKVLIDRIKVSKEEDDELSDFDSRLSDSVSLAFAEGNGTCQLFFPDTNEEFEFNNRFELDGIEFTEPSEHFFTFNNPFGACKTCEGFGSVIGIDQKLVIPDTSLSVYQGAVACWKGETMGEYLNDFILKSSKFNFPIHRPIIDLTKEEIEFLWEGNKTVNGISAFFKFVESQTYKIQYRVMLSRYRGKTSCPDCKGTRLRKDTNYVLVGGKTITDIVLSPLKEILPFFKSLNLDEHDTQVSKRLMPEITNRLFFLSEVGLDYLTLNRQSNSLSGGESQRINLSTSLGSSLVGSMYILDEPSIGLHPRDTKRLISVLKNLRDLGNTVIIVEHEEEIMRSADEIIDIGPMAGVYGGEVVFQGNHSQLKNQGKSLTANYLSGERSIEYRANNKKSNNKLRLVGATENNMKNVTVEFPLNQFVCITGVSGSGKSTLVKSILYPALRYHLGQFTEMKGNYSALEGDINTIKQVEFVDQNPIGKSSRSNPATYVKAYDDIRELYSRLPLSKTRGYKPGFFSFNVEGGRCEMCEGEGEVTIGMQFMADVHLLCETCEGKRFKQETLEVEYRGKNIADILDLDIEAAFQFFTEGKDKLDEKIAFKLQPLVEIGLGYLKMGQASSTLSGGEAQRIKLASFLAKGSSANSTLFIFDEPTTGLHFYDIEKLLIAVQKLIDAGNSVFIIEHNVDVIKAADWIIDIGPEGGNEGGKIIFTGKPTDLVGFTGSYTGEYI